MKHALFACLFLLPLLAFGQNHQSVDLIGGVEFSFRRLVEKNANVNFQEAFIDASNQYDQAKLNWRYGLNYNRRVGKRLWLRTGVRLASLGYQSKVYEVLYAPANNGNGSGWGDVTAGSNYGSVYGSTPSYGSFAGLVPVAEVERTYLFAEVPLVLRYETGSARLSPYFELGVAPSFHLQTRSRTYWENEIIDSDRTLDNFNKFQMTGLMAFGLNYRVSDGWQLFAQPTVRYHFTDIGSGLSVKENLYNYGLEVGIRRQW